MAAALSCLPAVSVWAGRVVGCSWSNALAVTGVIGSVPLLNPTWWPWESVLLASVDELGVFGWTIRVAFPLASCLTPLPVSTLAKCQARVRCACNCIWYSIALPSAEFGFILLPVLAWLAHSIAVTNTAFSDLARRANSRPSANTVQLPFVSDVGRGLRGE